MAPRVQAKVQQKTNDASSSSSSTTRATTGAARKSTTTTTTAQGNPNQPQNRQQRVSATTTTTARRSSSTSHQRRDGIDNYIPPYLRDLIIPYHGDFCYTPCFHPRLITQLMAEGFLPIATQGYLLPKLHEQRSVITLPHDLHISKSVRKKAKRFAWTVNQAFDRVVQECRLQHGSHCWLYPPLVQAFQAIHLNDKNSATVSTAAVAASSAGRRSANTNSSTSSSGVVACPVRLYSIEVWNAETGQLAGGELGYTVNSIYTSLTGFSKEDSAGSVQLAALGRLLCRLGFTLWDLGMDMEYKQGLGATLMPRQEFVSLVHHARVQQPLGEEQWKLPVSAERVNCKDTVCDQMPLTRSQQRQLQSSSSQREAPETAPAPLTGGKVSVSKSQSKKHRLA